MQESNWVRIPLALVLATGCLLFLDVAPSFAAEVQGTVIMVKGNDVTIRLDDQVPVNEGDKVEIYMDVGGVSVPYGTWRVSAIRDDGSLEATPADDDVTQPSPTLRATVHATGSTDTATTEAGATGSDFIDAYHDLERMAPALCNMGMDAECYYLGNKFKKREQYQQAVVLYDKACSRGHTPSCVELGLLYRKGRGVARDDQRAAELYAKACSGGQARGCNNLGYLYEKGYGVSRDDGRAVELYEESCSGGEPLGCKNLGDMYKNGKGVARNNHRALELYGKSCDAGEARGCASLGYMYDKGKGVAEDDLRAAKLYEKGCDGGSGRACSNLGLLYENGEGVPQDDGRAVELYRKGCDKDNAMGCGCLGWMQYHGRGTAKDKGSGVTLLEKGCNGGHQWSCDELDRLQ